MLHPESLACGFALGAFIAALVVHLYWKREWDNRRVITVMDESFFPEGMEVEIRNADGSPLRKRQPTAPEATANG